ncbi:Uncharacterised protein [Citrobacter freundii]|nr:Uncharacterised protein [Citrobacter freundii]
MITKPCPFCGKLITLHALMCPHCQTVNPFVKAVKRERFKKRLPHRYSDHLGRGCYLVLFLNINLVVCTKSDLLTFHAKQSRLGRTGGESKKSVQITSSKTTLFLRGEFSSAGSLRNCFLSAIPANTVFSVPHHNQSILVILLMAISIQSPIFFISPHLFIKIRFSGQIKVKLKSIHQGKAYVRT